MPRGDDDDYDVLSPDLNRDPEKGSTRTTQTRGSLYRLHLIAIKGWDFFFVNVDAAGRETVLPR